MSALATIAVGALAEQAGVDIATLRFYERLGFIEKPRRAVGGLQLYRISDIARVIFVRRTQELGFSTESIRELLALSEEGPHACRDVHEVAERHLLDIRRRLNDLARLERMLAPLVSACPQVGGATDCPILNALSHPT